MRNAAIRTALMCTLIAQGGVSASTNASTHDIQRCWTLVREDLDLFIDPTAGELFIEGTLVARLDHQETANELTLAINSRDTLLRFRDVEAASASVELNTTHADMSAAMLSQLTFDSPKKLGDEVVVSFSCHTVR